MEKTIPGKILQYHLTEKIGSGFAGDVYHAWDSGLDRNVAVKFIKRELTNDRAFRAQMMTAVLAARELSHPNVAKYYGIEENDGQMVVVMEYIQGQTLKSMLHQKPLDFQHFLKLAVQLSEGLLAIHRINISHKYITSDNIIISSKGDAKLTDLGLAPTADVINKAGKSLDADKLTYLSPEILTGQDDSPVSDQYSLGVVLFEALTGNLPFQEDSKEQLIKVIENPAAYEKTFEEISHGDVYFLITKLMAKLPEDRFSGVDELITTIKEIDLSQNVDEKSPSPLFGNAVKSRLYVITSLAFLLLVLFWLIVKGLGG